MKAMAYVSMALAITPVCGPLIGGYLQHYFDWRMNFIFLLGFTVVVYCLLFRFLPETNTQCHQHPISIKNIFRHYQFVLSHRLFLGATLCGALVFAGEITYILMAPFIFQTSLGLNALQFGWLALFMVLSMMMGSYMSTKLSHKLPINTLIWMGLLTALLGALSLLLLGLINIFTVTSVLIPMMISMLGLGIVYPNASALAVIHFTQHAGIAAALYGAVAMAGTGLYSVWVTGFHVHNQIPLALLLLITNLLAFLTYYVWIVPHKLPIESENS
jgi:DHA1 family bicyclomycin/chloramphenicol resistance-like MFS transporter